LTRNAQLFVTVHGSTWRLLTITQCRVKNNQFIGHVSLLVLNLQKSDSEIKKARCVWHTGLMGN
jgi:hypothetical protein